MSKILKTHFIKFAFRTSLFIAAAVLYIISKATGTGNYFLGLENNIIIKGIIWVIFAYEVIIRFFPSDPPGSVATGSRGETQNSKSCKNIYKCFPLDTAERMHIYPLFYGNHRQRRSDSCFSCVFHLRSYLYSFLLPIQVIYPQKQMLYDMQNLQLGLCDDVYTLPADF